LYVYDTLLEWLAQDLKDMAAELGQFIQEEHAMVGQRHLTRHRHVAAADQPRLRDGMVGRATRAGRDPRRAVAGEADDVVDLRGLNGLGEGHGRQDSGEAAGQPRLARSRGAQHSDRITAGKDVVNCQCRCAGIGVILPFICWCSCGYNLRSLRMRNTECFCISFVTSHCTSHKDRIRDILYVEISAKRRRVG
jgi:hypothetical protein